MITYHQVATASLHQILKEGLNSNATGSKSKESSITATDNFLDKFRPSRYIKNSLSRQNSAYAYLPNGDNKVFNITDGAPTLVNQITLDENHVLVRLKLDPYKCYVSNLDMYDSIKSILTNTPDYSPSSDLATLYWNSVVPLLEYADRSIRRPEIMIPYDIAPEDIFPVN